MFKIAKWPKSTFHEFFFSRFLTDFRKIGTYYKKSFFTKIFLIVSHCELFVSGVFLQLWGVKKPQNTTGESVIFWFFGFLPSFFVFPRQVVKRKVVPREKCQHFDTMMTYFPEPRRGSGMFVFTSPFLHGKFCIFK